MNRFTFVRSQLNLIDMNYDCFDSNSLESQLNLEDVIASLNFLYDQPQNDSMEVTVQNGLDKIKFINKWIDVASNVVSFSDVMIGKHGRIIMGLDLLKKYLAEQKEYETERLEVQKGLQDAIDGKGIPMEKVIAELRSKFMGTEPDSNFAYGEYEISADGIVKKS